MHPRLRRVLESNGSVANRAQLLAAVPHHVLDHAVARGQLLRAFPRIYVDPEAAADPLVRRRAALRYAGQEAALSHDTALVGWQLPVPNSPTIHVTTSVDRQLRGAPGLLAHRRKGFKAQPPYTVVRAGLRHVRLERALVESWPLLAGRDRRAPVIFAVQQRLTLAERVLAEAADLPRLGDRGELLRLAALLQAGCHSELEIWGYLHIFNSPLLPPARRQAPVSLGQRTVYLDLAYDEEMVDVELDGAAYHGPNLRREHDLRRDAAVASKGWLTQRFSHARLHGEPDVVRRELRAILEMRRQQLCCG